MSCEWCVYLYIEMNGGKKKKKIKKENNNEKMLPPRNRILFLAFAEPILRELIRSHHSTRFLLFILFRVRYFFVVAFVTYIINLAYSIPYIILLFPVFSCTLVRCCCFTFSMQFLFFICRWCIRFFFKLSFFASAFISILLHDANASARTNKRKKKFVHKIQSFF